VRSNRSLLVRLLAPYLFALVAVSLALNSYSDSVVERRRVRTLSDTLLHQARLTGSLLPWDVHGAALDQRCQALSNELGARITVIAADGTVIGDSDAPSATLDNHRERPEVQAAFGDGDGQSTRLSPSAGRAFFYRAWRQSRDGEERVIRLAVPVAGIASTRHRIRAAVWTGVGIAALAAIVPALIVSRRLSRRLSRLAEFSHAVAHGDEPPSLAPEGDDDVSRLERDLITMASSLSTQLQTAREEQGKLAAVLSSMVEGVLVIDRNGIIRLSNRCAEQLFGLPPDETMVGTPLIAVSRDPDLRELVRGVMRGDSEPPLIRETQLEGAHLQVTATPIAEADGEPRLFILVFHDISALKRLEATRRDFVANVSHELRTPLTAIRGYAETLQAGAINDPHLAHKFIAVIERHSERLTRITDDLLTLSDLELGRTALQRHAVTLAPVVEAAIEVVREKAMHAQVQIQRDLPADIPTLCANADRIEQVLVNLLDNAVKYTQAGGSVTVSARRAERPFEGANAVSGAEQRPWLEICVTDTGIGIPSQDLPRLTERFYRVDKARSRELGGTGLGLAIVKHIVQLHGGVLRIESELGRGTSVHVYLPLVEGGETS
jgi:two-component system, OmpR family, phosphate regulon sensor histidine kinase PhoR